MTREGAGAGKTSSGSPNNSDSRAKGALLAHIRHELRTPVNAILGYSEMLIEDEPDGPATADLQNIQQAGRTLLSLINEILDPAKIEAQGERADVDAFGARIRHDLLTPVNTVIGYTEMLIEDRADDEAFVGDVRRIHGAGKKLLALIDDIVSHSRAAGAVEEKAPDGVSSMIQRAVQTLDQVERTAVEEGGQILVVDDNEINRDMLSRRLERQGYTPECAENGREALDMLHAKGFDLVLLDILMPEMNGFEVLQRIKDDPTLRHLPVIMISALDEIESVVRCIEIGAEDFLPKPFNPVLLKARIGACMEKKRLRDREVLYLQQIEAEKKRADDLLHVILPDDVVAELKSTNAVKPRRYEDVAVLFSDIVGFTPWSASREPEEILENLQMLFMAYEELASKWNMYKIKTIGDAFMSTAGLVFPVANPVANAVSCALEMARVAQELPAHWQVRVGIHAGPVMAGVAGRKQYLYDLWGDTVNTASRVESHGVKGAVCVSGSSWARVADLFDGESRGIIPVKGKGDMEIYLIHGPK